MPKIKTRKSISKRFRMTGSGKMMRRQTNRRHILVDRSPKRMRKLSKTVEVNKSDQQRILRFIGK